MFSEILISAIRDLSGQLAGEIQIDEEDSFKEVLAETVLGAGCLGIHGYSGAQREVDSLIYKHGWNTVVKEAAKYVCY